MRLNCKQISADTAKPLRLLVLYPGLDSSFADYPEDKLIDTTHFGCFAGDNLIAIATLCKLTPDFEYSNIPNNCWRLRGMASHPDYRGQHAGSAIIDAIKSFLKSQDHTGLLWCHARVEAVGFYQKQGFSITGESFDVPSIGEHFNMTWQHSL